MNGTKDERGEGVSNREVSDSVPSIAISAAANRGEIVELAAHCALITDLTENVIIAI